MKRMIFAASAALFASLMLASGTALADGETISVRNASEYDSVNEQTISVGGSPKWLGAENSYGGEKYGGSDAANKAVVNSIVNSSTGGGN